MRRGKVSKAESPGADSPQPVCKASYFQRPYAANWQRDKGIVRKGIEPYDMK